MKGKIQMDKKEKRRTDGTYFLPCIFYGAANLLHLFFTYTSLTGDARGVLAIIVCILFHAPLVWALIPTRVFLVTIRRAPGAVVATLISMGAYVLQIFLFYYGMTLN